MKLKDCKKDQKIALSLNYNGSFKWDYDANAPEVRASIIGLQEEKIDRVLCYFDEEPPQIVKDYFKYLKLNRSIFNRPSSLSEEYNNESLFAIHSDVNALSISMEDNMNKSNEIKTLKEIKSGSRVSIPYRESDIYNYFIAYFEGSSKAIDGTSFYSDKLGFSYIAFDNNLDSKFISYYGNMLISESNRKEFNIPDKFKYGHTISSYVQCKEILPPSSQTSVLPLLIGLIGGAALLSQSNKLTPEIKDNVS
jgi:hypothetical protein